MAHQRGHRERLAAAAELVKLGVLEAPPNGKWPYLHTDHRDIFELPVEFTDKLVCECHGFLVAWVEPRNGPRACYCPGGGWPVERTTPGKVRTAKVTWRKIHQQ